VGVERVCDQQRRPVGRGEVDRHGGDALEAVEGARAARPGDHERALVDKGARDGEADALAGPGDDRDLAAELEVHRYCS
jgi:hypothetical protein